MEVAQLLRSRGPRQCWVQRGCCHRRYGAIRAFSSLWQQLCPSEDPAWRWNSCSDRENSGAPSVQGPQLSQPRELWPSQGVILTSGSCSQSASVAGPSLLLPAPSPVKAVTGQPVSGAFHCPGLTCGDREATAMAPPPVSDSAGSPCLHGCPGFLHRHFPLPPPPSRPLGLLPRSQ